MKSQPIKVHDLCKSFHKRYVLENISFEIMPKTFFTLVGKSGCGKTTLLNCIGLIEPFDCGSVNFGTLDVTKPSTKLRRNWYQNHIGFLFQNSGLVESWSVVHNLLLAMDYKKLGKKEKYNRIAQALDHMGLAGYEKRKVYTLSGGQQQRVGLARLFLKEANLVLVDEPTASLDDNNANVVISGLKELAKQGAKVVVATHDRAVIQSCDHTYELTEGSN